MTRWIALVTAATFVCTLPASQAVEVTQSISQTAYAEVQWLPSGYTVDGKIPNGNLTVRGDAWLCGLMAPDGKVVYPPSFEEMGLLSENTDCHLIWVMKAGQYGLLRDSGELASAMDFRAFGQYSEGFIPAERNGKAGYLDAAGNVVIPFRYARCASFENGYAEVWKDVNHDFKQGMINTKGEEVIPCEYSQVMAVSEGMFAAHKGEYWGYLNEKGQTIIPFTLGYAGQFQEGAVFAARNGKFGYFDKNGKQFVSFQYDGAHSYLNGLAGVCRGDKWGFIDGTGKEVIPCQFEECGYLGENGLIHVKKDGKWGAIDKTGTVKVPCIYESFSEFRGGVAIVTRTSPQLVTSDIKPYYDWTNWGIIDETGEERVSLTFTSIEAPDENGLLRACKDGKYGWLNKEGTVAIPICYDSVGSFQNGFAVVCMDGKYGYINAEGDTVIPRRYDFASDMRDCGYAVVQRGNRYGIVAADGTEVLPCQYEWAEIYNTCAVVWTPDGLCGVVQLV